MPNRQMFPGHHLHLHRPKEWRDKTPEDRETETNGAAPHKKKTETARTTV